MHPETIDAMDYLYANEPDIIGACTFSYYHMIEYGVRRPDVMVGGTIGGKPLTYVTDVRRTIATQGIWFPFHPVVTTDKEWRPLRGWDRTHEYDAAYELVETIYDGHSSRRRGVEDQLENGVYSFQYHPELGARSVRQRRQGRLGLCPLRDQPGGAPQLLDPQPARALPAHGGLRGAACFLKRRRRT